MDKLIEKILDDSRYLILTSGNINDFANMCGRFAIDGDTTDMEDWWYALPDGDRYVVILSNDKLSGADESFTFKNGVLSFRKL